MSIFRAAPSLLKALRDREPAQTPQDLADEPDQRPGLLFLDATSDPFDCPRCGGPGTVGSPCDCETRGLGMLSSRHDAGGDHDGALDAGRTEMTLVWSWQMQVEGKAWSAAWIVHAPWAHPVWSDYALLLVDLTAPLDEPTFIYLEGATHELMAIALDPDDPVDWSSDAWPEPTPVEPANHMYQFAAASNDAARRRIGDLARAIAEKRLSPDAGAIDAWDRIFADGLSLRDRLLSEAIRG